MVINDVLFDHVSALHAGRSWSSVLDAGTGKHSLRWVRALPTTRWTAVTADPELMRTVTDDSGQDRRPDDRIVLGEWTDETLLEGEVFDVVLADYLLGAVDGFTPYFQPKLFERLARHVGDRLYVVGLEPLIGDGTTDAERMVTEMARVRDAVLLLVKERPYREFPSAWVRDHLERAGLKVVSEKRFPTTFGHGWVDRQIQMSLRRLRRLPDASLAAPMERYLTDLRRRAHDLCDAHGGLRCGSDHVFAAAR